MQPEKKYDAELETVYLYIERRWIIPRQPEIRNISELDEEDLARIQLIRELQEDLGVNDDAVPIILNLIDQLHQLRFQMKTKFKRSA
jgi:chaperone modulatory protein CbpM